MLDVPTTAQVSAIAVALRGLVADLDVDAIPLPTTAEVWNAFDTIERLAAGSKVLLARRVAESNVWQRAGYNSAAVWMSRHAGTSVTAAQDTLATSRRIAALPATTGAVRAGDLSVPQTVAIADAARVAPDAEGRLVSLARRSSLGELRRECLRTKAAADPDPERTYRRIHVNRRLRMGTDAEGAWTLHARGPVDAAAAFKAALEPIVDEMFRHARDEGRREPREAYAFDALVELGNRAANPHLTPDGEPAASHDSTCGDDGRHVRPDATEPPSENTRRLRGPRRAARDRRSRRRPEPNPRYLGLLRIDLEALIRGRVDGDELCEVAGLGPIPVSVARGLLGDTIWKLVITKGQGVGTVVHLGRSPTVAQQIALRWLHPECAVEGCHRTDLEWDHRVDWAHTHHTRLDQLDGLCRHHHALKTRRRWALVAGTGKRAMVPPDHPNHPRNQAQRARPATAERAPPTSQRAVA